MADRQKDPLDSILDSVRAEGVQGKKGDSVDDILAGLGMIPGLPIDLQGPEEAAETAQETPAPPSPPAPAAQPQAAEPALQQQAAAEPLPAEAPPQFQPGTQAEPLCFGDQVPVDQTFADFFSKSAAVIPGAKKPDYEQGEYVSDEELPPESNNLFQKFLRGGRQFGLPKKADPIRTPAMPKQMPAEQPSAPLPEQTEIPAEQPAELPYTEIPAEQTAELPYTEAPAEQAAEFVDRFAPFPEDQAEEPEADTQQALADQTEDTALFPDEEDTEEDEAEPGFSLKGWARSQLSWMLGRAPDEEGPEEEPFAEEALPEEEEEELEDDYNDPADAPAIQADLEAMCARLGLRAALTGLLAAALIYLGASAQGLLPLPGLIDPALEPQPFLVVCFVLLALGCALGYKTVQNGIFGLTGDEPTADVIPALALLGAAVQLVVLLAAVEAYDPAKVTIFAGPALLLLCLNALGKQVHSRTVEKNFALISNGVQHVAAYHLRDEDMARRISTGLAEEEPNVLLSRPTNLVKGFLGSSFSPHQSDERCQKLAWVLLGSGFLATVLSGVILQDIAAMASAFAATFCLGGPLAATLVAAVPASLMQKSSALVGAVVPGWRGVKQLSRANVVQIDAEDLFPVGSVQLHGIKTFEKERIDLAILYAASVLDQGSAAMRQIFLAIIQNDRRLLLKTEGVTKERGRGMTAWIDRQRIIVGNRKMMEAHGIDIPSMDYEKRYTKGERCPVYLAVAGQLFGLFVVSYRPNPNTAQMLQKFRTNGISLLVRSEDFCVSTEVIENAYDLPHGCIKVLSDADEALLAPAQAYLPQSEGCLIHVGGLGSLAGGVQAAASAESSERAATVVMSVSTLLGGVLSVLLAAAGGLAGLMLPVVLLYQAAWCALTLILPALKKY